MADYIDRAEVMEWVENWHKMDRYYHPYAKGKNIPTAELADIMERIPSADVRENVHGEWVTDNICSVCGDYNEFRTNFCPNCGARMVEDE